MAKHTPGPWNVKEIETGWIIGPDRIERAGYIADVHKHTIPDTDDTARANARLIAAAPDLYEALIDSRELSA